MLKNIEETLVRKLAEGPREKQVLIHEVVAELTVTPQAVYKALRKLFAEEVMLQKDDSISLSLTWIEEEVQRLNAIAQKYDALSRPHAFLTLREGESLRLRFKTLKALDLFWTEAFLLLEKTLPESLPAYSVSPHDWFNILRPKTDSLWTKKQNRFQRLIITHPLELDKKEARKRNVAGFEVMINANPFKQEENEYKNIIGPWVFEVKIDPDVNDVLVEMMKNNTLDDMILTKPGLFKFKVTRSNKKTSLLLKKVGKYF